jgi:hypothetical protein
MMGRSALHCLLPLAMLLVGVVSGADPTAEPTMKRLIYSNDFATMDDFWVEGGERAWVENGRLHQKADPADPKGPVVSTVWCRKELPENVEVHVKACVVASVPEVNNINFFLHYRHPKGLWQTRDERASGDYKLYHGLEGYIFTFLRDAKGEGGLDADGSHKARARMRRCPGFRLVDETFAGHCEAGKEYAIVIRKLGGTLTYSVDGVKVLEATDPTPLDSGFFGFRTYRTHLWWSALRVYDLGETPKATE